MSARVSRSLSPKQRARADALFDELLELSRERRRKVMSGWQLEDPVVVEEVASLLRAAEASREFLSHPVQAAFLAACAEVPADEPPCGSLIGDWRVIRVVGRGGMLTS
jgi:hypothetical protein